MGFPTRIGIATHGYRRGDSDPGKVCIATHGYRCLEAVAVDDGLGGGMGHGAVIQERYPEPPKKDVTKLAVLAIIAIEEYYD